LALLSPESLPIHAAAAYLHKPMSPHPRPHSVALVTGAADRIGAAIATALAAAGWQVVIHYRASTAKAQATAAEITAAGGSAALVQADLASRADRATLISRAAAPFGRLTLLVNNASTFERDSIADLDEQTWDAHFAVHAEAPAFLARDFGAQLPAGTNGNIVNIIDERVLDLSPAYFSYTLSKAVLWTMTRTLAQSLAPRIRVNAISPGLSVAPVGVAPAAFARRQAELPLGRAGDAGEIAQAVLSILAMPTVTGQMLALDGGGHLEWPAERSPTPRRKPR
jgi:NAD(P)-dependent dehydrogenase (short-subunit alcohol dehydrogenase family)